MTKDEESVRSTTCHVCLILPDPKQTKYKQSHEARFARKEWYDPSSGSCETNLIYVSNRLHTLELALLAKRGVQNDDDDDDDDGTSISRKMPYHKH